MTGKINKEWLTKRTGDPFADIGGYTIEQLWTIDTYKGKDILQLIEELAKIYVQQWGAGQLSPFFLNSKITQPAFKADKKIEETLKFYKGLIEETDSYELGYCRILGVETKLFVGARDNHLLSGSGTFINFHHAFQNGVMLSKEVLIRMFFVPFGTVRLSDKIAVLDSNNEKIVKRFVRQNVKGNISQIANRKTGSMFISEYNNPTSALFDFVKNCLNNEFEQIIEEEENVSINLYHFTNFGASPEVVLHNFSAPLFGFCRQMMNRKLKDDWRKFVQSHYYNSKHKKAVYNISNETYDLGKNKPPFGYEDYNKWVNWIYQDLLNGKSILRKILNWNKKYSFNFKIVRIYQKYYRNMKKETLDKIEQIADYIVSDKDKVKRRLTTLRNTDKVYQVRRFLINLVDARYREGEKEPLFSMKEYVNYIFPDGMSGKEIRDLLLICIYQKLHEEEYFIEELETGEETLIEESN